MSDRAHLIRLKWYKLILAFFILGMVILGSLSLLLFIFPESLIKYLKVNSPIETENLIVEGWVSDQTLEKAVNAYKEGKYNTIITTGGPLAPFITLYQNGYLQFDLDQSYPALQVSPNDTIILTLAGTPSQGTYPHYRLIIDDIHIGDGIVGEEWHDYYFPIYDGIDSHVSSQNGQNNPGQKQVDIRNIIIYFDNDDNAFGEDRNLSIKSIRVGNITVPARSEGNAVYTGQFERSRFEYWTNVFSYAEECKGKIERLGVPEAHIVAISAPKTITDRTYTSALAVAQWIDTSHLTDLSFNILTEGLHARRTWYLYKSALRGYATNVGIISSYSVLYLPDDHKLLTQMILRELTGNIYYRLFFNKRKLKREFLGFTAYSEN